MTAPNTPAAPLPTPPEGAPQIPPTTPQPTTEGGDTPPIVTETPGTEAPQPTTPEWGDNFDPARAWQTIQNQRNAEAKLKTDLAAERAKVADFERERMTEAEKMKTDLDAANARLAEVERKAAEDAARQAFDATATAAGVLPNALTAAHAIAAKVASSDESGSMILDEALFASLKADHGYLFATETPQAAPPRIGFGAASSQGLGGSPTSLTPQQVAMAQKAGIDPEDFAKHSARAT